MQIIYYNNQLKQWQLNTHKITYTQHGESNIISYTHDLQWWEKFVEKWSHTTIDSIEELEFTSEQITRLEHIKHLPEDFGHIYSHYVETGELHEDVEYLLPSHPFHVIALKHKEVKDLEKKLLTPIEIYERLDKINVPLEQLKHHKLNQLNELCNKAIVSGFTYNINEITYLFSASIEAQSNFQATDLLFKEGLIQDVEWSVNNLSTNIVERITLTQEEFNTVKMVLFNHVNSQIAKYRNILQPQVLNATTNEEVDSINW